MMQSIAGLLERLSMMTFSSQSSSHAALTSFKLTHYQEDRL